MQDFILEIDNFLDSKECDFYLELFKSLDEKGFVQRRSEIDGQTGIHKDHHMIDDHNVGLQNMVIMKLTNGDNIFLNKFWKIAYPAYNEEYSILKDTAAHGIYHLKIQRTSPGQGYHVWHHEDGSRKYIDRLLTFICYLEDVEEGGETEFLYLKKRIKPKAGKLILFPGSFTHTHRGLQPISGDKHVITGWIEYS